MKSLDCIFLAAGIGKRMKKNVPKQLIRIGGKPILIYSLETLVKSGYFKNIIITYPEGYRQEYEKILSSYFVNDALKKFILVKGGETRQESVFNGLKYVDTKRVLIHEAARPFLSLDLIKKVLSYSDAAVVPVISIPFTVAGGDEFMKKIFKRDELKNIQLPQVFDTPILLESHQKAREDKLIFTDDSTLVFYYGNKVRFVPGEETNIKITTPTDLLLAERILFAKDLPSE